MTRRRVPHYETDQCRGHCYSHMTDEPGPAYLRCGECFHAYRTRWHLWTAATLDHTRILLRDLTAGRHTHPSFYPKRRTIVAALIRVPLRGPSRVTFCPHCIHDL